MPTANANTGNGFTKAVSYAKQELKVLEEDQRPEILQMHNVAGTSREIEVLLTKSRRIAVWAF